MSNNPVVKNAIVLVVRERPDMGVKVVKTLRRRVYDITEGETTGLITRWYGRILYGGALRSVYANVMEEGVERTNWILREPEQP